MQMLQLKLIQSNNKLMLMLQLQSLMQKLTPWKMLLKFPIK